MAALDASPGELEASKKVDGQAGEGAGVVSSATDKCAPTMTSFDFANYKSQALRKKELARISDAESPYRGEEMGSFGAEGGAKLGKTVVYDYAECNGHACFRGISLGKTKIVLDEMSGVDGNGGASDFAITEVDGDGINDAMIEVYQETFGEDVGAGLISQNYIVLLSIREGGVRAIAEVPECQGKASLEIKFGKDTCTGNTRIAVGCGTRWRVVDAPTTPRGAPRAIEAGRQIVKQYAAGFFDQTKLPVHATNHVGVFVDRPMKKDELAGLLASRIAAGDLTDAVAKHVHVGGGSEGEAAWFGFELHTKGTKGKSEIFRVTGVAEKRDQEWAVSASHWSLAVPNKKVHALAQEGALRAPQPLPDDGTKVEWVDQIFSGQVYQEPDETLNELFAESISGNADNFVFGSAANERYVGAAFGNSAAGWKMNFHTSDKGGPIYRQSKSGKVGWALANVIGQSVAEKNSKPIPYRVLFVYEQVEDADDTQQFMVQAHFSLVPQP